MQTTGQKFNNKEEIQKAGLALTYEEFKESLGVSANKYTDEQIRQMWRFCDMIANVHFDTWLVRNKKA